jgi:hypothetical protein
LKWSRIGSDDAGISKVAKIRNEKIKEARVHETIEGLGARRAYLQLGIFFFQKKHKIRCFLQQTHKWCTFLTPYIAKGLTLLYHNSLVNILSMEDRK